MAVCRLMTDKLKEIGLMKGDTEEAVKAGAHAMFLPHGLGHMMGMDVHDMEGLGQNYVGLTTKYSHQLSLEQIVCVWAADLKRICRYRRAWNLLYTGTH